MKNLILASAALMGMLGLSGTASATTPVEFHGSQCMGVTPVEADKLNYTAFGVHNVSSEVATVICPITLNGVTTARFSVTAYDRSTISDIACHVFGTTADGNINLNVPLSTTGNQAPAFTLFSNFFTFASTSAHLQCAIPAFQPGFGFSHLTTYRLMPL